MTTREVIEALPSNIRSKVEYFREQRTSLKRSFDYALERHDRFEEDFYYHKYNELCEKWKGYCSALRDAGVIDNSARKHVFIYGTILCGTDQSRAIHEEGDDAENKT